MTFDEYQQKSMKTALDGHGEELLARYALGVCGEAGEIAEHIKKTLRDNGGKLSEERRQALKKELGDVLWYLSQITTVMEFSFTEIAVLNIEKLYSRYDRGVIQGDGDER